MKISKLFPHLDAIIFDLGNVIINLDIPATDLAFQKILGQNCTPVMQLLTEKNIFQQYEKGKISTDVFVNEIASAADISDKQSIKDAWNAMLLDIPDKRFEILLDAKANYQTFCLSNTNDLHIEFIYRQLMETKHISNLNTYFEKVYLSHEMGMRKPDEEIFKELIDKHQLNPSTTLFIDDTKEHLDGAKKVGLQTLHMKEGLSLEQLF